MDERIKKTASKLQDLVRHHDDVSEVYYDIRMISQSQSDYFLSLGPDNLIKLTIYVYSLKKTGNFELGEKMIDKLTFIQLLTTENKPAVKECESCDGMGETPCEICRGSGLIECSRCDGSGEVSCEWCDEYDIEGGCEECDGRETMDCNRCQGSGAVDCRACNNGQKVCITCGGEGEVTSEDEVSYEVYFIATWNKQIIDLCELRAKTLEPVMSLTRFLPASSEYLELSRWEGSAPLNIDRDQMYCIDYSTEPNLYLQKNMIIRPRNSSIGNIEYLE